jgi:homoserine/homoserine lactone efflux protein
MQAQAWITFCAIELVLCLTPGPAVLYVATTALGRGPRAGLAGAAGIVAGNTFYFVLSALGIATVILASNRLFTMLKWAGAAYLVYVGSTMLLRARGGGARTGRPRPAMARAFAQGFAVQAANPKALAFFVALLPQFLDPAAPVAIQILILGLSSQLIEIGVLSSYVWLSQRARGLATGRLGVLAQRVAGGLLVAAGARLALVR